MKKIVTISFACILFVISSCKPDNNFSIGQADNRIAQLAGTWKLQSVIQTDLIAKSNNFVDQTRTDISLVQQDITSMAPFTDLTVNFATDANGPSTFAIN